MLFPWEIRGGTLQTTVPAHVGFSRTTQPHALRGTSETSRSAALFSEGKVEPRSPSRARRGLSSTVRDRLLTAGAAALLWASPRLLHPPRAQALGGGDSSVRSPFRVSGQQGGQAGAEDAGAGPGGGSRQAGGRQGSRRLLHLWVLSIPEQSRAEEGGTEAPGSRARTQNGSEEWCRGSGAVARGWCGRTRESPVSWEPQGWRRGWRSRALEKQRPQLQGQREAWLSGPSLCSPRWEGLGEEA